MKCNSTPLHNLGGKTPFIKRVLLIRKRGAVIKAIAPQQTPTGGKVVKMVSKKSIKKEEDLRVEDQAHEESNEALKARIAELEAEKRQRESVDVVDDNYIQEIERLRRKSKTGLNEIKYKEIAPEMVKLWHVSGHNVGKLVGPIILEQAEETFLRFRKSGIRLSSVKPSEEWIERYKQTEEYKNAAAIEAKRRAGKSKTNKESQVEKLTAAIAKSQGVDPSKLNSLADEGSVKHAKPASMLNEFSKV